VTLDDCAQADYYGHKHGDRTANNGTKRQTDKKQELFGKVDEYDLWAKPQVEDVITPCTEFTMVESQCIDWNGEYDICFEPYSVKTRRGHVIGARYLQDWVDAGFTSCEIVSSAGNSCAEWTTCFP
jgi:hypothetical protein